MTLLKEQWQSLRAENWPDVCKATDPQLNTVERRLNDHGRDFVISVLNNEIGFLVSFFNVTNTFSSEQLVYTSELIYSTFPFYKLSDIRFFCRLVASGTFGQSYNRLDGPTIMTWLRQFDKMRDEQFEMNAISGGRTYKEEAKVILSPEEDKQTKEILQKIYSDLAKIRLAKQRQVKAVEVDPDIQLYYAEFDALWDDQVEGLVKMYGDNIKKGNRFVEYNGKNLDQIEYIKCRMKENKPDAKTN